MKSEEKEQRQLNVRRNLAKFMRDEKKVEDRRMKAKLRGSGRNTWGRAGLGSCWV